jgi:hypothetical protein
MRGSDRISIGEREERRERRGERGEEREERREESTRRNLWLVAFRDRRQTAIASGFFLIQSE